MKFPVIFAAAAASLSLSACEKPIPVAVTDHLANEPVGSYKLLPINNSKGPTGKFNLVIKTDEFENTKAHDSEGKSGVLKINRFFKAEAILDYSGNIVVPYYTHHDDHMNDCYSTKTLPLVEAIQKRSDFIQNINGSNGCMNEGWKTPASEWATRTFNPAS